MPVGWPEMQIMQRASNGHMPMVAFNTNTTEPKPTGYLNLYEYNLEETMLHIKPGDTLDIHDSYQSSHFSLAYYSNGTFSIPLISFVVGDCESETDPLTLNILNCEDATMAPTSDQTSTQATTPHTSSKFDSTAASKKKQG